MKNARVCGRIFYMWGEGMTPEGIYAAMKKNYPKDIGRYVVANSMLNNPKDLGGDFAKQMQSYVNQSNLTVPTEIGLSSSSGNIQKALQFLIKVINNERAKENKFIQYLSQKTGLKPPTTSEDWKNFVREFQENLSVGQHNLIQLENELQRLQKNQRARKGEEKDADAQEKKRQRVSVVREVKHSLEYTRSALVSVVKYLGGSNDATIGGEIIKLIVDKYGSKLFSITEKGGQLNFDLNPTQTYSLLIGISQILAEKFYTKKMADFFDKTRNNKEIQFFENKTVGVFYAEMDTFLKEDKILDKQIQDLIERTKVLPFLTDDLIKNYKMIELPPLPSLPRTSQQLNLSNENIITELRKITTNAMKALDMKELTPTIHFIQNSNNISELQTGLTLAIQGAIANVNAGDAQAKTDNIIGYLSIDPVKTSPKIQEDINKIINDINIQIHEIAGGLKQTNTADYYSARKEEWNTATQKIQELLDKLQKLYGELIDCFLIEESTKGYYFLYTPNNRKDFEGGSLGGNIVKQIETITALQGTELISPGQAEWLITAAINAGKGLIGSEQRTNLENYLSMFATILLFDDQQNIANEVATQTIDNIPSPKTGINKIHLFTLNNGYYPLSFVLQLTFDKLYNVYTFLRNEAEHSIYKHKTYSNGENGAKVVIKGFINPDDYYTPNKKNNIKSTSWDQLATEATESVTMEIYFLTSAMSLIQSILNN